MSEIKTLYGNALADTIARNSIGDLSELATSEKGNLVAAINEAAQSGGSGSGYSTESITRTLPWEVGTINRGADQANTTRMRSKGFIPFDSSIEEIRFSVQTGYKYSVYLYDENNAVITTAPHYDAWMTTEWVMVPPFAGATFRVLLARTDNANMSDSDLDGMLIYKKTILNILVDTFEPKISNDALTLTADNFDFKWECGDISETTGGSIAGGERRSRTNYIYVGAGSVIKCDSAMYYGMWIYLYNKNDKSFIGDHGDRYVKEYRVENDCYIRIMIRSTSDANVESDRASVTLLRKIPEGFFRDVMSENYGKDILPTYYDGPIKTAISNIKTNMETVGITGDTFIFFSDVHWPQNVGISGMVIDRMMREIPALQTIINGGDTINSASDADTSIPAFMASYMPQHGTLYNIVGNHDHYVSDAKVYATLLKHMDYKVTAGGFGYYYFDNTVAKTRYVCLNTSGSMTPQITWLNTVLESMPDGYNALVFAHIFYDFNPPQTYEDAYLTNVGKSICDACDTFNTNHATKKVFAIFGGHVHVDLNYTTTGGIPLVLIDNNGLNTFGPNTATAGTITESVLDIVTVDYTNKTIKCERIGRGTSRSFTIQ